MKKVGIWNYYESLNKENYLLLNKSAGIGDNLLAPFNKLYEIGIEKGINFMTLDMVEDFKKLDRVIFFDFPNLSNKYVKKVFDINLEKDLVVFESELIKPDNWDIENHKYFNKIFTWKDDIIDNKKYFKFNFAQEIPKTINKELSKKEKLCTLIAGNKKVNHPLELYSKRIEAIRWFEKNHPQDFDFYGIGWDEFRSENKYVNILLRKSRLSKIFKPSFSSYKGKVDSKKEVLEKYKFAICYENAKDISGYITEKIFDCFFAGCIPVYWGADNIIKHIPKECFIDKREFDTYEELYHYIKNMSDEDYIKYLNNIENFLNSEKAYKFSSEFFVKTLIGTIIDK
ncbi:glycosyltransferase family 10 domain-containing protein [Aliarcobacter skirrowii]|uniref:glycosyltransferase family 10 domain-containing protein n=1 Tax=Aliarcobacter skirrowii TaxID=28200 RepID=UPI0029BEDE44|nr:glycosyltransferase family 10 [Aliarcobacter skirrowii]MDX4035711.1 glycosyltransferase family 10 [Aliarcobacter skirrowii]